MALPEGEYVTSITIDNVRSSDVGRVLDLLREGGFVVEVNLSMRYDRGFPDAVKTTQEFHDLYDGEAGS